MCLDLLYYLITRLFDRSNLNIVTFVTVKACIYLFTLNP